MFFEMNVFWCSFILFLANTSSGMKCGMNVETEPGFRIVGGTDATKGQIPWQISLLINGDNHICGGSIIGPIWVLCAAHCLDGYVNKGHKFYVVAGALVRKKGYKIGQMIEVEKAYFHPRWDRRSARNDIMLLKLKKPLKFGNSDGKPDTTSVGSVCLPDEHSVFCNYKGIAKVSGYGLTTHKGRPSDRLKFVKEHVLDEHICQKLYGRANFVYDRHTMVCYGNLKGGTGTCQGDSGGPLVVRSKDQYFQIGVLSYGSVCGGRNSPAVFSNICKHRQWIKKTSGL